MFKEFKEFLQKYGVIGLAIAVIIGGKLNLLVTSLVNDLLTPLILQPALQAAGLDNINKLQISGIFYGKVLSALIEFTLVAFMIFIFSKKLLKEEAATQK